MANPAQTSNDLNLASQPVEGGDSKYSTITHDNKMPSGGDNGVTHSGSLNEMPPDGYLLAEEPDAGGAPPAGSNLERLANKDQVSTTEEGGTLDCGRYKVWRFSTSWNPSDRPLVRSWFRASLR